MTLIKSISGIRGIVGGKVGEGLTPLDIVKFTSAYAHWLKETGSKNKVVIGRDARISGPMVSCLVSNTLISLGINVIDLGLATTPTVEFAVHNEESGGGIIITASHNPGEWNALKLLNSHGEFLNPQQASLVLDLAENDSILYNNAFDLGEISTLDNYLDLHIEKILNLKLVDTALIRNSNFKVAIDAVNSVGGFAVPALLEKLGVNNIVEVNCDVSGKFSHNPEPLPENLHQLKDAVSNNSCDLGIAVDPDVDRLALICENGEPFGEEYSLVAVADYILSKTPGNTVSNLSSTMALKEITVDKFGQQYYSSAVGEINVVEKMKQVNAVIGGEGNGGIIYPQMHYGRDALTGIALFLTHLAILGIPVSQLRSKLPDYKIVKKKIDLNPEVDLDVILQSIAEQYNENEVIKIDGIKIIFDNKWVHLRKSNTEPVIRIIGEATDEKSASQLVDNFTAKISETVNANT